MLRIVQRCTGRAIHPTEDIARLLFQAAQFYCKICIKPPGVEYFIISSYDFGALWLSKTPSVVPSRLAVNRWVRWSCCTSQ